MADRPPAASLWLPDGHQPVRTEESQMRSVPFDLVIIYEDLDPEAMLARDARRRGHHPRAAERRVRRSSVTPATRQGAANGIASIADVADGARTPSPGRPRPPRRRLL